MKFRLALAVVVAFGAAGAVATAAPAVALDVSQNWAGYVAVGSGSTTATASTAMTYTDVTGTWQQPSVTCSADETSSTAVWVGIGGYSTNSQALEQTGTSADCDNGKPSYYIWYELVPADSVNLKLKIKPGDTMTASVVVNGTDVLVQVKDRTRGVTFTKHVTATVLDQSSAEWIAEAPSDCNASGRCNPVPLSNFGSVTFSKVSALGNGAGGRLVGPGWSSSSIQLIPDARHGRFFGDATAAANSTAGATPAASSADCGNATPGGNCQFAINFVANAG